LERARPRSRLKITWKHEVREDGRVVGGEGWLDKLYNRGMEEAPDNYKESSHCGHCYGMNKCNVNMTNELIIAC
jgi:hypothetical protein